MATLHNFPALVDDQVYDVVWGTGRIAEVLPDGRIRVLFAGDRAQVYANTGQARTVQRPTLFWHDPVFLVPSKKELNWAKIQQVCRAVYTAMTAI
jgi:hypothetical protein